jgi:hypothetical protein
MLVGWNLFIGYSLILSFTITGVGLGDTLLSPDIIKLSILFGLISGTIFTGKVIGKDLENWKDI